MKKSLLNGLIKASGNPHAGNINTCKIYQTKYHVDTGNYILNACLCGDMFKGIPGGKVIQWAGIESTGKSFLTTNMIIYHIKSNKNHISILFESEGALSAKQVKAQLTEEECDRFLVYPVVTIEDSKRQINLVIKYIKSKKDDFSETKFLATYDSIGMPASAKEKEDSTEEKAPVDMTRAKAISSLFRTICMDFAILGIPFNVVNHQYSTMDQWAAKEESGGKKLAYANSMTMILSKSKLKDEKKEQVGTVFKVTPKKSRIVAENISKIEIYSKFKLGMDRYSGLFEFLKNHNLSNKDRANAVDAKYRIPEIGFEITLAELSKMTPAQFWTRDKLEYINKKFQEFYLLERIVDETLDEEVSRETVEEKPKTKKKGK